MTSNQYHDYFKLLPRLQLMLIIWSTITTTAGSLFVFVCVSSSLSLFTQTDRRVPLVINQWCRIMNLDRSGHFKPDVLALCVMLRLELCVICALCKILHFFSKRIKQTQSKLQVLHVSQIQIRGGVKEGHAFQWYFTERSRNPTVCEYTHWGKN